MKKQIYASEFDRQFDELFGLEMRNSVYGEIAYQSMKDIFYNGYLTFRPNGRIL